MNSDGKFLPAVAPIIFILLGDRFVSRLIIAANAGIGHVIRIALYQSDLSKILAALFLIGIFLSLYQGTLEWMGEKIRGIISHLPVQ